MATVSVSLVNHGYTIYIEEDIFPGLTAKLGTADKWLVLTDENVDRLYGERLTAALGATLHSKVVVPPGEVSKSFQMAEKIINAMVAARLTRRSAVIAFGGGVIGDLAGFCASVYMRGIPYVQIPTTLLAQVDSSVGGKTGVNVPDGKNMAGTFCQPQAVFIGTSMLRTLPEREFTAGMGEVIKYGIMDDYSLFAFIEANFKRFYLPDCPLLEQLISRCCQIKARIVAVDEKEDGLRKILNYGHTYGHAIETLTGFQRYLHGEAVLIGMHYETLLAQKLGFISDEYAQRIMALLERTGISADISDMPIVKLVEQMSADKKNNNGKISFILPTGIGQVSEHLLTMEQLLGLHGGV